MIYRNKKNDIYASELAEYLGKKIKGKDIVVMYPGFCKDNETLFTYVTKEDELIALNSSKHNKLIIVDERQTELPDHITFILSDNPKLDFVKLVNAFYTEIQPGNIAASAHITSGAKLGFNVVIGENVFIGPDVCIGDNTVIMNNVVIKGQVVIGSECIIKDNTVIGSEGYDYVIDENGIPMQFPHFGKIVIYDNVIIGSNSTIESATLKDTVIHDHVKIDDLIQVGAGSDIETRSMIAAGTILCRNVTIGSDVWIAPGSCIREDTIIGDSAVIGIGSVVLKDVMPNSVYYGNPAKKKEQ